MNPLRLLLVATVMVRIAWPANLAISTCLKDGFTPTAIASDSEGNVYLAGSAVIDAASDQVSGLAIDGSGNAYVTGWTTNPNFPVVGGGLLRPAGTTRGRSSQAESTRHGGVFGASRRLGNFNGPGHCAYAVRQDSD